jgi:hypothetical protein
MAWATLINDDRAGVLNPVIQGAGSFARSPGYVQKLA